MKFASIRILSVVILSFFLLAGIGKSQSGDGYLFQFSGEPMDEALDIITRTLQIDLVYNPTIVRGIDVYERIEHEDKEGVLKSLLHPYRLDYITLSSGTIVIVQAPQDEPGYGGLAGKVVDARSGRPLPGATVMLADASGGTSSGASGNFAINGLMSGSYDIIVSYVGYEPVKKTIEIPPGGSITEEITLAPRQVYISPLVVEGHHPVRSSRAGAQLEEGEWNRGAGGLRSPIRNLNLMPGVQHGLPLSDLHLQGGERGDHRIFLDGMPIYNPYSFGRMYSSFSPYAIGEVTLHKAGYGVARGSQMAGMIDLAHDVHGGDEHTATFQADPLSANLRADFSIPAGDDRAIEMMAAARTSFWDLYQDQALSATMANLDQIDPLIANLELNDHVNAAYYSPLFQESDLSFRDLHLAGKYEPDLFSTLSASFYYGSNRVLTDLISGNNTHPEMPAYLFASDMYDWNNVAGQMSWNRMVTPRLDMTLQAAYSKNRFTHQNILTGTDQWPDLEKGFFAAGAMEIMSDARSRLPARVDENSIRHGFLKSDFSFSVTPRYSVDWGAQVDRVRSLLVISDQPFLPDQQDESSLMLSGYIQNNHRLAGNWRVEYGSRFTWMNRANKVFAEPRASVQYHRDDSPVGYWSARLAGGLYRQFVQEYRVTNIGASSLVPDFSMWAHSADLPIPSAYHVTGSLLVEPSETTSVTFEGYIKHQPSTPIVTYTRMQDEPGEGVGIFAGRTRLDAFGGGVRLEQSVANNRFRFLGGYDYSNIRVNLDSKFGGTLSASWNEPHRAQFRTFYHPVEVLTVALKWQGIWGRSWAFRDAYYNFLGGNMPQTTYIFDSTSPQNDRLPPFHQVDVSFIHQSELGGTELEIRLELVNILNRENTLEKSLRPVFGEDESIEYREENRRLPGFYPTMSVQLRF